MVVGRGRVIADTTVADLVAAASGDRVTLRTAAARDAAAVLAAAGAGVRTDGPGQLTISGLPAERVVALLAAKAVPFSEVSAHRATLEQAYLELTKDEVEYRAEVATATAADDTPERSGRTPVRRAGFAQVLRAEWTKFRTVRGWVIGMIIAALVTVGIALLDHSECGGQATPGGAVLGGLRLRRADRAGRRGG